MQQPESRHEREARADRILLAAIGGLVLVAAVVTTIVMMQAGGHAGTEPTTRSNGSPAAPAAAPPENGPTSTPAASEPTAQVAITATATATTTDATPIAPEVTTPEKMASLPTGTRQIVVITGARLGSNAGVLEVYDLDGGRWARVLRTGANFGKAGLVDGATRTSGHLQTPTGIWSIGGFLFGQHPAAPAGTRMPYRAITGRSWWSSERDATYNTWVESRTSIDGEHLIDSRVQYEYAFDTGYNSPPNERVIGRGAAIFIHCSEPPGNPLGRYTHGCVAIDRAKMLELFAILDPARRPVCAIGTLGEGTATSVYSY